LSASLKVIRQPGFVGFPSLDYRARPKVTRQFHNLGQDVGDHGHRLALHERREIVIDHRKFHLRLHKLSRSNFHRPERGIVAYMSPMPEGSFYATSSSTKPRRQGGASRRFWYIVNSMLNTFSIVDLMRNIFVVNA